MIIISSLDEDETLQIVLSDICDIQTDIPEPEWVKYYIAPGQDKIDKKIITIENEMTALQERLDKTHDEKENIRKCLKLLYEREYEVC